jgi:hypothetical protein
MVRPAQSHRFQRLRNRPLAFVFPLVTEEASLDLRNLLRALHDTGARGRLMCESPAMEVDAQKFKALWLEVSGEEQ